VSERERKRARVCCQADLFVNGAKAFDKRMFQQDKRRREKENGIKILGQASLQTNTHTHTHTHTKGRSFKKRQLLTPQHDDDDKDDDDNTMLLFGPMAGRRLLR